MIFLIVILLIVAFFVYVLIRKNRERKNPELREQRLARLDASKAKVRENEERAGEKKAQMNRQITLLYAGGHPKFIKSGLCSLSRSEDGNIVHVKVGKESIEIPTESILQVELLPETEVRTKQKSGLSGAIAGDLIAGPAGAFVGALATRKKKTKMIPKDTLIWTVRYGTGQLQILFKSGTNKNASQWYPKAASILAPTNLT